MKARTQRLLANRCSPLPAAALALCAVAVLQGCGSTEKEPEPVVAVQVAPAKKDSISKTVSSEAVVYPLEQAVITPKITSTIHKFYVQRGSHVKKGELLAQLENQDLAGAAEESQGEYEEAQAGYATTTGASLPQQIQKAELDAAAAQTAYDAQKKVYDARKELFDEGAIPRRDLDTAQVQLAQTLSQNDQAQKQLADLNRLGKAEALKSANGQLTAAKGKYLNARAMLSYSEIRSPIDGMVTDRPFYEGELATANQPILTVMNTAKLIAKAHIVQSEAVQLKVGDDAEIFLPGIDQAIKGRVMLISPALDPGSTTIEVWVEAIKPGLALKPGMSVSLQVIVQTEKNTLVIPASAVFKSPEGNDYVMLAGSDSKAHQTNVKVGIRNKEFDEIQSGVKSGDAIIITGGYGLPDGSKITIEAPTKDRDDAGEGSADHDNSSSGLDAKADKSGASSSKEKGKE
ncbi:MAG TPA: efflux RND transporter periplasmic adaptor subunit [Candidatus Sulfotelmatobacter sp.]|nr:efflux RND transporter periplasmic adaptor subunit [Candidatus Sulfotelmatobacter sp.]